MSQELAIYNEDSLNNLINFKGSFVEIFENKNYKRISTLVERFGRTETKRVIAFILSKKFDDNIEYNNTTLEAVSENILINYNDISLEDVSYFATTVIQGRKVTDGKQLKKVFKYDSPTVNHMIEDWYHEREIQIAYRVERKQDIDQQVKQESKAPVPDPLKSRIKKTEPYKNITDFCDRNKYSLSIFALQYEKQYEEEGRPGYEPTTDHLREINAKDIFINHKADRFIYYQNKIIQARTFDEVDIKEICRLIHNYQIEGLVVLAREMGIWGTRTPYCDAAKKFLTSEEDLIVTFRFNVPDFVIQIIRQGIEKIASDSKMQAITKIYITGLIFNFVLDLDRFEFENTEEGRVVAEYKKEMHTKYLLERINQLPEEEREKYLEKYNLK